MKKLLFSLITFGSFLISDAYSQVTRKIDAAAKKCEADVLSHCLTKTCPEFCEKSYRSKVRRDKCKAQCTKDLRCHINPLAGMDAALDQKIGGSPLDSNGPLSAQSRDQLIQCIVEERDPEGTQSGRRMIHWEDIVVNSFAKRVGRPAKLDIE